jgi:hypothetical protein
LKKQVPDLLNRHHASGVVFDVTVRDGRAIVQARPKK